MPAAAQRLEHFTARQFDLHGRKISSLVDNRIRAYRGSVPFCRYSSALFSSAALGSRARTGAA
jgi:hypothetical protein